MFVKEVCNKEVEAQKELKKIRLETFEITIEIIGDTVIAPIYIDLYPFGFLQAGMAREGYRMWKQHRDEVSSVLIGR